MEGQALTTTTTATSSQWYGAAFGVGRSAPAWVAALHRSEGLRPSDVVAVMVEANRRRGRWLGIVVAAMALVLVVTELMAVVTELMAVVTDRVT